jgi:hypothetical protein
MVCQTCPQSGWSPASARVPSSDTRLDTGSADPFLLRTPGSGWLGDGHGRPLDRPVGRTSPVCGDRPADGPGPGPDGDGQAADTSRAQHPTMRLASRPRPTTRPKRPSPDRTGQDSNAHARLGQPQPQPASGPLGHHHLHLCSMPGRPQAWSPSDVHAVPSGVHNGHHDRTAFRTPHAQSYAPDTVPSARHAMANRKRRGQGTDERHGRPSDILDRHDHKGGPPDAPPVGPAFAAWQPRSARQWQHCQRDRNHGSCLVSLHRSSRASAHCCPRTIAGRA